MVTLQRIAVCLGKGLGQFAAAMGISKNTVSLHLRHITEELAQLD